MLNITSHLSRFFRLALLIAPLILLHSFATAPNSLDNDVLRYTNKFRKENGLGALVMRSDLNAIARKHSEDMAKGRCGFGHSGFNQRYEKVKKIFKTCTTAENVAYGASTGKQAVEQWENSSPHRKNLLGKYKYTGIGTARDKRGRIYYTQILVR